MSGPLPHTSELQAMADEYLADAVALLSKSLNSLRKTSQFRSVYRNSLAADAVLSKLLTQNVRPKASAARSLILRIPFLAGMGQIGVANIELRRFIEVIFWSIYFTDHPVEWESFERDPSRGYERDMRSPIQYCAHREAGFYADYAKERLRSEPSKLAVSAVESLRKNQSILNADVHPGKLTRAKTRIPPLEKDLPAVLKQFGALQKSVFSQSCILIAAVNRNRFNNLQASERAHFDWLVGSKAKKLIRGGPFGLSKK